MRQPFKVQSRQFFNMARNKTTTRKLDHQFIAVIRELRSKLHDIDAKLEHLIRSHRHFYSLHYKERELDD